MEMKKVERYDAGYTLTKLSNNKVGISKKLIIASGIATVLIGGAVALTSCEPVTYNGNMLIEVDPSSDTSNTVSSSDNQLTYDGDVNYSNQE